jgi:orotate phosphoribosyltransferase
MSDETTESIIKRISAQYTTPREIPGGHTVSTFFDCINLTPTELARLAAQAIGDLPISFFDMAVGVAFTGIFFSGAVAGGREVGIITPSGEFLGPNLNGKKILIVDDVIVRGSKVLQAQNAIEALGGNVVGFSCIIFRGNQDQFKLPIFAAHSV